MKDIIMPVTIVVVDDNKDCAAVIVEMLARMGYQTIELRPGPALLDELAALHETRRIDVLVTDLFMPVLDGFEIIRFARLGLVGVPIIGMSAGHKGLLELMVPIGATDVIEKPINPARLKAAIESALKYSIEYQ